MRRYLLNLCFYSNGKPTFVPVNLSLTFLCTVLAKEIKSAYIMRKHNQIVAV